MNEVFLPWEAEKMRDAEKVLQVLTEAQLKFIESEFSISNEQIQHMDDNTISELYDKICDIEVEETMAAGDGELSERGKMAESIVSVIGNELYRPDDEPEE